MSKELRAEKLMDQSASDYSFHRSRNDTADHFATDQDARVRGAAEVLRRNDQEEVVEVGRQATKVLHILEPAARQEMQDHLGNKDS